MRDTWLFGYGSLVSPTSLARTIGRTVVHPAHRLVADLAGYGRRWNYGSLNLRGSWRDDGVSVVAGVVISLGLEASDAESCNGVIVRVTDDELAALDWRERDYQRTDVTEAITLERDIRFDHRVVTYVPRPSAVARYRDARDRREAAVRSSYWNLVHQAFEDLGGDHLNRFSATPAPDVPVTDITLTLN